MMLEEDVKSLTISCKSWKEKVAEEGFLGKIDYQWDPRKIRELLWGMYK